MLSLLDDNNIIIITDIFAEYEREIFFDNNEFAEKLLEKSHRLSEKVQDKVFSKISFLPFSGMQAVSCLGEHDTLATKVITLCEEKLKDTSLKQYLKEFYINLKKFAEGEDKRKLERDKLELEEEEWG